jgi:imidazoleglycerol phosphate dehydratase HisB
VRRAVVDRRTAETQIRVRIGIEGKGRYDVRTGSAFSITCSSCSRVTAASTSK